VYRPAQRGKVIGRIMPVFGVVFFGGAVTILLMGKYRYPR
jgi:hypothetical protein